LRAPRSVSLFERAEELDLIHNSFDFLPLTYSALVSTPVLTAVHGFSSAAIVAVYGKYDRLETVERRTVGARTAAPEVAGIRAAHARQEDAHRTFTLVSSNNGQGRSGACATACSR
jgi:hypothetical protein